jgi:hypothetical protein
MRFDVKLEAKNHPLCLTIDLKIRALSCSQEVEFRESEPRVRTLFIFMTLLDDVYPDIKEL